MSGVRTAARGVVVHGQVWPGGDGAVIADGVVVVDARGAVAGVGPRGAIDVPLDVPVLGGPTAWVGPGIVDAHVHLAFGGPDTLAAAGVTAARDLGAPPARAADWRAAEPGTGTARVAVAGPLLTAPGGYPSRGWGADGFASFVSDATTATAAVRRLAGSVDVIKVAIEPAGGPTPDVATVRAVVEAAHDAGLAVAAHALTVETVRRALAAGVDELAHTPVEALPADLVDVLAGAGVSVVSTLSTFVAAGVGDGAVANAAALHAAGVTFRYGTDLGNAGTAPRVDVAELELLAEAGLGRGGALRAATVDAAQAPGMSRTGATGQLALGGPADLVVLSGDPLADPTRWRAPETVLVAGRQVLLG